MLCACDSKEREHGVGVGVMKDKEVKVQETEPSHTLGGALKYTVGCKKN